MPQCRDLQGRQAQVDEKQGEREHAYAGYVQHLWLQFGRQLAHLAYAGQQIVRCAQLGRRVEHGASQVVDIAGIVHGMQVEVLPSGFERSGVGAVDRMATGEPLQDHQHLALAGGGARCGHRQRVDAVVRQLAFDQAADGTLDAMALWQVGVTAVHVDVMNDRHGQLIQAVEAVQSFRQPGQQRLTLGVRGGRAEKARRQQRHAQRHGQGAVLLPEQLHVQWQLRLGRIEHAELHQLCRRHFEPAVFTAIQVERTQDMVGVDEGAGGEQRGQPALEVDQLIETGGADLETGVGEQRGDRAGDARQYMGFEIRR